MGRQVRVRLYVVAVAMLGAAVVVVAVPSAPIAVTLAYAVIFALAELLSSRFRDGIHVSLSNLVVLVALIDQGWRVAVLCTLGSAVFEIAQFASRSAIKMVFNVAQFAASAAAAAAVYVTITELAGTTFPDGLSVVAVLFGALAGVLVNLGLLSGVVALASGEPYRSALGSVSPIIALQVPYAGLSILAAVLLRAGGIGPLLLVLLFLPVFIARSGLAAFERVEDAYDRLVRTFVTAIEVKDLYTRGHSERVAELSVHVAEQLGIPYQERRLTRYAALLHDVGKIGVPLCIINKPGPLDDDEFDEIKQHPTIGAEILRDIDFLEPALDIVRYHHERLDGQGYPHGIGDEELGELVRIVTAVDAFDAMTSTRSYRRALGVDEAIAELRRCADAQFDRRMVEALAEVVVALDWQPTVEFASIDELDGAPIPHAGRSDGDRPGEGGA